MSLLNPIAAHNGDLVQTPLREGVYMAIDGVGASRQTSTIIAAGSQLAHSSSLITGIASAAISVGLCVTGAASMLTAAVWTIPDAFRSLKNSYKEVKEAETQLSDLVLANQSLAPDETPVDTDLASRRVEEAKTALPIAQLGLANQALYFSMGAAQVAAGVVDICSPTVAHALHVSPVLTGGAATTAALAAGVALGGIYVLRGGVMMARAAKSYSIVRDFDNAFKSSATESIEKATEFLQHSQKRGEEYLGRRVDTKCLKEAENGNAVEKLQALDKGIFTEKFKHKVAILIAAAMILGGVLAIVASCLFPGTLPVLIILLVSAVFFLSAESVFLTYDSSRIFEWLRNHLYTESSFLTEAIARHEKHLAETQALHQSEEVKNLLETSKEVEKLNPPSETAPI